MTNTFITAIENEGHSIITAGEAAWTEAKAELEALEQTVLTDVKNAIATVIQKAEDGTTIEDLETMVLNLLQAEVVTVLKGLSSGLLQTLIAFAKSAL